MNYRNCRNYENLERRIFEGVGEYGMPEIKPAQYEGACEWINFNCARQCNEMEDKGVHFFVDDYRFNRLWTHIDDYVPMLQRFRYVMSPDFSTYSDFPKAIQIYNHYRKHWCGAYLQETGIEIIPTISWSTPDSFDWCFDGEPEGGTVAISNVGCMRNHESKTLFIAGYQEMIKRLHPETIIFYGTVPEECMGNIVRLKAFHEKFKEAKCNGW